jgi:hypothetical protein
VRVLRKIRGSQDKSSCLPPREQLVGFTIHALLVEPASWIHRRVETVEVLDHVSARRRVSLDLTVDSEHEAFSPPDARLIGMIPLTLLRKETLRNFDLRDPDGKALPVLTKEENGRYEAASLIFAAEGILGHDLPAEMETSMRRVVVSDLETATAELETWGDLAHRTASSHREDWAALLADDSFVDYALALAENFVLMAVCDLPMDQRMLFKLSYEEPFGEEDGLNPLKSLLIRLGWRRKTIMIEAPTVNFSASYHLEIPAPPDLEIDAARLTFEAPTSAQLPDEVFDDNRQRAHLYKADIDPEVVGRALIYLRHRRDSYLAAALLTGLLISALIGAALAQLDEIAAKPDHGQTAAAVLLVAPTIMAAYLFRSGEHRLAALSLLGLRAFVLIAAACAIVATALLAGGVHGSALHCAWTADFVVSCMASAGLLLVAVLPLPTRR